MLGKQFAGAWPPVGCISQSSPEKQNKKTPRVSTYLYLNRQIYYEGLAHVIMETKMSQDL